MFEQLRLTNFTAFESAEFKFSRGINLYVGANGSGKTHVLKLLYALQKHQLLIRDSERRQSLDVTLMSVFKPDALGRLVRRAPGRGSAEVAATWDQKTLDFHFSSNSKEIVVDEVFEAVPTPVFVPAKDILGHSVNFADAYDTVTTNGTRWLDFDVTYRDLLALANPDIPRGPVPEGQAKLIEVLRKQMTGKVSKDQHGRFYLHDANGKLEFPLVAEGWRKLALFWTLIRTGSLGEGTVLYWDEPEANLNPKMYRVVAELLTKIAKTGVQVHVASHAYAFIRELELFAGQEKTPLIIFGLDQTEQRKSGVSVETVCRFTDLKHNPILDEYNWLYGETMRLALTP